MKYQDVRDAQVGILISQADYAYVYISLPSAREKIKAFAKMPYQMKMAIYDTEELKPMSDLLRKI